MRIPLQFLPAFRAAAQLQSLRAAASLLNLTPSAISQQISALEQQLGFALFERQGRRVLLNAAGKIFLQSVDAALDGLEAGARAARAGESAGADTVLRLTVVPSFAQRWLLPRIGHWRERHPNIRLSIEATQQSRDLQSQDLHAGIRFGNGHWQGLEAEMLSDLDLPLLVVGSPHAAHRLKDYTAEQIAREPLLGDPLVWQRWLDAAGIKGKVVPVASFAETGLMLQAAEHDLGLALARGVYTVDALVNGNLVQVSQVIARHDVRQRYYLVYPPALRNWAPLLHLRAWLFEELQESRKQMVAMGIMPASLS
ncbi:LysR substrate-binding domain-containing protein [Undibacterium sp. Tian12W]|uniref:LysR substrate-binding domain-containing protein n=1 Tax=Undibacterium sp. Tian12W TaxID=3413054 RepID=UPI003BF27DDE